MERNNLATVAFVGFDARGPAVKVLRDIVLNEVGLIESDNPHMVICSEDSDSMLEVMQKFPSSIVRVLFNGELGAADFNRFDYVIGWEARSLGPRYVSMHPALRLRDTSFLHVEANLIPDSPVEDRRFCSFIYTNGLAHPVRDQFFHKLNSIQKVDSWGGHLNNAGPLQNTAAKMGYELEKMLLESKYKFSIAIENGVYPGYTTEKIFSAISAGAVPIYWGNPDISQVVNPARILSLHDYDSLDMAVESILKLAGDKSRLLEILKQPMMTAQQVADVSSNKAELIELINHASNTALRGEVLRPMGTTAATFELRLGLMLKREKRVEKFKYLIFQILKKAGLIKIFMQALNWLRDLRNKIQN